VANGWNNLVDIYTQNISTQIEKFKPSGTPPAVFGADVAIKMAKIIGNIK
jgi:hypothetical protein